MIIVATSEVTMSKSTQKSMSFSSKSSIEDDDLPSSMFHDDDSIIEDPVKTSTAPQEAKQWPEDSTDFLSHQQDNSSTFCSGLFSYCCHVFSSPRRFLSAQKNALLYSYMSPVLRRGAANHKQRKALHKKERKSSLDLSVSSEYTVNELSKIDLYTVPSSMEAQRLADLFWSSRAKFPNSSPSAWSFLKILWIIAKPTYIPGGYWQLITVLCQCSLPLLVREVLMQLEDYPSESFRRQGLSLAFAIFAVSLLQGLGDERQKFLSFRTGITLRSAVVSAAHAHLLNMTPRGRIGLTSGEITNLVAVDAQKLFELAQEGHYSWACPLAMVIVSVLLLLELGPAAIVGIVTMFLIVPMVQSIVRKMMSIRKQRVGAADKRIEIINSMLQGIRFTKLNRYEDRFMERVMEHRSAETKLLRKELFFLSLTLFATVISPVLASCLTFITYALMGEENVLTTSVTFTSIFLFAALRFPINYAGKFMGKAAQGFQACYRFSAFFARESVRDVPHDRNVEQTATTHASSVPRSVVSSKKEELTQLIDISASFCAGVEGSFTLNNIEMKVKRSQIMCVVGPVASGKSTLVQGLIGEIIPLPTTKQDAVFDVEGKVSYASQIPFILNATVRDNILFGEPYDEDLYDRVLEACCLKTDIEQFHSGDMTEIGERGKLQSDNCAGIAVSFY
jgi:ABC-type multidrug transport system fused ATPase/permease subunit